jgi:hypothetical protein
MRFVGMRYFYEMQNGQRLDFENEGGQTYVNATSSGSGQQQSQGHGFTTGEWSKPPSLFRLNNGLILEIHTGHGSSFVGIDGNQMQSLQNAPDLGSAELLEMKQSSDDSGPKRMKPMEPMRPMEPMKPMAPMKPMGS